MRIVNRHDLLLLGGLTLAAVVIFARPIRYVLDMVREIEQERGLALVPALIILALVLVFHQQIKRQESKLAAAAAEADARQAMARAQELESLVAFGQALARALDVDGMRDALDRHLRRIVDRADPWVLMRAGDGWQTLLGLRAAEAAPGELEAIAGRVLTERPRALATSQSVACDGHTCFPLVVGEQPVGVLGLKGASDAIDESGYRAFATAAALIALACRKLQLIDDLREHSLRDGLTGCFNRTHGLETLEIELRRARRSRSPLSLLMFDVDHFKQVNDEFGHLCGDAVLAALGRRMRETLRNSDLKVRYGGEEFMVLLPDTPLDGARHVAESLRRAIGGTPIVWDGRAVNVTASFGVTVSRMGELDGERLVARADAALYDAKRSGRNCVSAVEPPERPASTEPPIKRPDQADA